MSINKTSTARVAATAVLGSLSIIPVLTSAPSNAVGKPVPPTAASSKAVTAKVPVKKVTARTTTKTSQKMKVQSQSLLRMNDKLEKVVPVVPVGAAQVATLASGRMVGTLADQVAKQELAVLAAEVKAAQVKKAQVAAAARVAAATKKAEARVIAQRKAVVKKSVGKKPVAKKSTVTVNKMLAGLKADERALKAGVALKAPVAKKATVVTAPLTSTGNTAPVGKNTPAWLCQVPSGNKGVQAWPSRVRTRILTQFPAVKTIGGFRPGDPKDHGKGLALDVMVPPSSVLGDDVARWSLTHFTELNLSYVIWKQHIWTAERPYWRKMEDRGSITANHFDHPHLSFNPGVGSCPA